MESTNAFFHEQLDSGVQVVGQPMSGVESAALGILIGTGARDEEPGRFGISHFTEQMLWRGTQHLDARALSERFDILGIDYDSSAGLEMTLLSAVLLGTKLREAIDLLTEVVLKPAFPDEEVEGVQTLILQELRQREDKPAQRVMDLLRREFLAGSPLSHDVFGTEETIRAITRDDLVAYWRDRFTANNATISIAGNFDWHTVLAQLQSVTASWPPGRGRMRMDVPRTHSHVSVIEKDTSQEHIGMALPGISVTHPDYYAAAILAQIFSGVSNSRLRIEVRENRGLAYAVMGRFDGFEVTGLLRIYVGTSGERAHESVQVVLDELRTLEADGVTQDELDLAKIRLKSSMVMRSESTAARMAANLRSWWFENRLYTLDEVRERIDSVTVTQIARLLNQLEMSRTITAIAIGPRGEEELFGELLSRAR